MLILAIDPGPEESAYVLLEQGKRSWKNGIWLKILDCAKEDNELLRERLSYDEFGQDILAMEEIVGRKWSGREVTDTAFWSGRLCEAGCCSFVLINRSKIRWHIGKEKGTNDSKIITRLIERFCPDIFEKFTTGELTRNKMINAAREKYFKGFTEDIWQAFALGVTWYDLNVH
jgi:hypothetical protein